jgi:hypothetical protein
VRVGMARVLVTGLSATMWINLMPSLPFHADTVRVDSAHQRSCAQLRAARNRSALPQFEVPTQPALPLKAYVRLRLAAAAVRATRLCAESVSVHGRVRDALC